MHVHPCCRPAAPLRRSSSAAACLTRHGALAHHLRADDAKKDKMEIQFAFLALAFFAAFMAARSLTAYFKKK
jgi:hypothetical protein